MDDSTVKLGLMLETAEAQQALAAGALERLHEHAAGLDALVREEIRASLIAELKGLTEDSRAAAYSLRRLARSATRHFFLSSLAVAALSGMLPSALTWYLLPTRAEVAALRAARDELSANVAHLTDQGGRVQLRRCGERRRLCVRVDRGAPRYGESADYLVVMGY